MADFLERTGAGISKLYHSAKRKVHEATAEYTCPNCGNTIRPGTKFCPNCGMKIEAATPAQKKFCMNCGALLEPGVKFFMNYSCS